jgi:hypothetical protein
VLPETWFSVYGDGNAAKIMADHIRDFINQ